jgi:hypothetical protein
MSHRFWWAYLDIGTSEPGNLDDRLSIASAHYLMKGEARTRFDPEVRV